MISVDGAALDLPYNSFDYALLTTGWFAVISFGYAIRHVKGKKSDAVRAHLLLLAHVVVALLVFAWRINQNPLALPWILVRHVFVGSVTRICILLFWSLNIFATVGFCIRTAIYVPDIDTTHRKFFHATASFVAVSGFLYDPAFVVLCGHLVVQIFIILEILRVNSVEPWVSTLNAYMFPFLDDQDSTSLILTPIHLIGGIFLPTVLELFFSPVQRYELPRYYMGVLTVGVGDALAACIGKRYGKNRWGAKFQGRKSIEGSLAMFVGQVVVHFWLFGWCGPTSWFVYGACTLAEATMHRGDNILLPIIGYFLQRFVDLLFQV